MARIAEESIQLVMSTVNIVDVVGNYFPLKRVGLLYKACCPFHNERTPSFTVSEQRNSFHCFGCGKGGSAIRFVMDHEGLPFVDAVRKLASRYGIHLKEEAGNSDDSDQTRAQRARLMTLQRDIALWFHQLLLKSPEAAVARKYLKSRGLDSEVAKRWLIGYAPGDSSLYHAWSREHQYKDAEMVIGGIYSPREEDRPERGGYPRFKHRVMFPIHDDHGNVIAFSGRVLDPAASPAKYVNSPGTPIFKKSEIFFGLEKSKKGIHKQNHAIICEGQIDMLICFEHGIENIVAPLGTALTSNHAQLLKRHTDQAILCYDSDAAGLKAAQSAFAELSREGIFVRVATMAAGDDPDALIRREGVEALRARLDAAQDFIDFFIDLKMPSVDMNNLRDRMALLNATTSHIARLRDRVAQDSALNRAALRLSVPVAELRRMVTAHARAALKQREIAAQREPRPGTATAEVAEAPPMLVIENPALRQLLQLALTDSEARHYLRGVLPSLGLEGVAGGTLLTRALAAEVDLANGSQMAAWLAGLPPDEESVLTGLLHDRVVASGVASARSQAAGDRRPVAAA
jgi:DNA primase